MPRSRRLRHHNGDSGSWRRPAAFGSAARLAARAGLRPGNRESPGKRRSGRLDQGSRRIRSTLAECIHGAASTKGCQFEGYHKALTMRRGYKRVIVATVHKLLRVIHPLRRSVGRTVRRSGSGLRGTASEAQCPVDPDAEEARQDRSAARPQRPPQAPPGVGREAAHQPLGKRKRRTWCGAIRNLATNPRRPGGRARSSTPARCPLLGRLLQPAAPTGRLGDASENPASGQRPT